MKPKAFLPIASSFLLLGCVTALHGKSAAPPNPPIAWSEVAFYAQVANAVYGGADETAYLPRLAGDWDIVTGTTPNTDVRYYVMTHKTDRRQLIAIRGTSTKINIVEDAKYIKREDGELDIYVHEGFDRCAREIHGALRHHLDTSRRIEITGHSLGGAVALLLGMELDRSRQFRVARIMTFGQPKVTNETGVRRFRHLPLTRIVDERDIVPRVPAATVLSLLHGLYRHLGEEVLLLDGTHYSYLDERTAEGIGATSFWLHPGEDRLKDHHMGKYLERIVSKQDSASFVPFEDRKKYEDRVLAKQ